VKETLMAFVAFVLVLAPLVFFHELGHFLVAKYFRIGAPVFSIGFGPRLFGWRRGGTDYRVSLVPLGGYVRLAGDEADENRTGAPEEFLTRSRWQRFLVFVAGAAFNLVLAVLAVALVFRVWGKEESAVPDAYPSVAAVRAGSPAEAAGAKVGERVISIAGRDARDLAVEFEEILLHPDETREVVLESGGARRSITLATGRDPINQLAEPGWFLLRERNSAPTVDLVVSGGAAAAAGLEVGDEIVGVEGHSGIGELELRQRIKQGAGRALALTIRRAGAEREVEVTPRGEPGSAMIGVQFRTSGVLRKLGTFEALAESVRFNWDQTRGLFRALGSVGSRVVQGDIKAARAFSGPIEIARLAASALRDARIFFLFMAYLSLNLGIINLMPIPVLDGGHILILALEGVMRREFSEKAKERLMQGGFVFLLAFFGYVIWGDVVKTWFSN
jgi:regulator of sigma E protease